MAFSFVFQRTVMLTQGELNESFLKDKPTKQNPRFYYEVHCDSLLICNIMLKK